MNSSARLLLAGIVIATIGAITFLAMNNRNTAEPAVPEQQDRHSRSESTAQPQRTGTSLIERRAEQLGQTPAGRRLPESLEANSVLREVAAALTTSTSPTEYQAAIARIRQELVEHENHRQIAGEMLEFLRSGEDLPTHLRFVVGHDGMLESAPTLRTAMLDLIAQIDPAAGLEISREILDTTEVQDEYAVALRNLAWWHEENGGLADQVHRRFQDMISKPEWTDDPSTGFLEAMDIGVFLGNETVFSGLIDLSKQNRKPDGENPDLAKGIFVALDRISVSDPDLVAAYFSEPGFPLDEIPSLRASLLSRLDITRPDHQGLLIDYLTSPSIEKDEREYFQSIYPNHNHSYGPRLASSQEVLPTLVEMEAALRRTRAEFDRLIANGRLPETSARPILSRIDEVLD